MNKDISAQLGGASYGDNASGNTAITGRVGGDVVGRDKNTHIHIYGAVVSTVTALRQIPPTPHHFTGREAELAQLREHLRQGATILGVHGMGGAGKTALLLNLADELKQDYPDGQFFFDLKGFSKDQRPLATSEAMAHIIHSYHPSEQLPNNEAALSAIYHSVLATRRALLLWDNAADADQVAPLVPPRTCVMLVTSRRHFAISGMQTVGLDAMSPEEARALLLKSSSRIGDEAAAIAKLCGYLPLALALAASALEVKVNIKPAEYAERLADAQKRSKEFSKVEASLSASYDLLGLQQQKLWRTLAVFPDTFDCQAAAAVWQITTDEAQDALGDLITYSLIEWNSESGRYRLHDLVRAFAASLLTGVEKEESNFRHAAYFQAVLATASDLYKRGNEKAHEALRLFDLELKNIKAGRAWVGSPGESDHNALTLSAAYTRCGRRFLGLRLNSQEEIEWNEAGLIACRKIGDRGGEAKALGRLGALFYYLHKHDRAIGFFEAQLEIARESGHRGLECEALGGLGDIYAQLGDVAKALDFHEQNLVIAREVGDRRGEGINLYNLGWDYLRSQEIDKAVECFEDSLKIGREVGDPACEGDALWGLSFSMHKLGDLGRAITYAKASITIFEALGDQSADIVRQYLTEWQGEQ